MESNSSGHFNLPSCDIQAGVAQESMAAMATMDLSQVVKGLTHRNKQRLDLGGFFGGGVGLGAIVTLFEGEGHQSLVVVILCLLFRLLFIQRYRSPPEIY